jgi:hydroxymethylpyrimidine pyrophosphatase-like HAD family hydrolase
MTSVPIAALATDYDGTLARDGRVEASVCDALERFKRTGRRLILVTGRELPSLERVFSATSLFDRIVAENGALLYDPVSKKERVLAPPPPAAFVELLRRRKVAPLSLGRCIVATARSNDNVIEEAICELGLGLQTIFNIGSVMVLPIGMNKATGLGEALRDLDLSPANVVGVGDAENDQDLLAACGCKAAVANALPMVKAIADIQLAGEAGAGVIELLDWICRDDDPCSDGNSG